MIRVVRWNIDRRHQAVEDLLAMDAEMALLQEVGPGALESLRRARRSWRRREVALSGQSGGGSPVNSQRLCPQQM